MKRLLVGLIFFTSMTSFASFEGVYNGQGINALPCTLEIISFVEQKDNIVVHFKSSMQKDSDYIFIGNTDLDSYVDGKVSGTYHSGNVSEVGELFFKLDRENETLERMNLTRWVDGKRDLNGLCTYLKKM